MGCALGIDLGTSNSVVSVCRRRTPFTIPIEGQPSLPSVVSFRDDGSVLVGRAAKSRMLLDPERTVASVKRAMGDRRKAFRIGRRTLSPVNISSLIVKRLIAAARQAAGEEIWDAVITVPAYFTAEQREDTKRAGEEAGLNVLRLVPEPTAAAIAYGLDKGKDQTIMVYDLGGGTFDVSILSVRGNDFEVRAVGGDSRLGGDDFDQAIMMWANDRLRAQTGIDIFRDAGREEIVARQRLKEAAEQAKVELSESASATLTIPECVGHRLELLITLEEYNALIMPMLERTVRCVRTVLRDAGLHACDIDRLILVGGSTKNRLVREIVTREIKEPYVADRVDEVVSHGAAIMAANLYLPEEDGAPVEVVAVTVSEVTGHTLGIDMVADDADPRTGDKKLVFRPIIPRQSKYPCRRGFLGTTCRASQTQVDIRVLRGESQDPEQNTRLGEISLPVLHPQAELLPIGAIFELDSNGIIHFTAVQLPLGPELQPLVQYAAERNGELDLEAVEGMIHAGVAHAKTVCIKYYEEPASGRHA